MEIDSSPYFMYRKSRTIPSVVSKLQNLHEAWGRPLHCHPGLRSPNHKRPVACRGHGGLERDVGQPLVSSLPDKGPSNNGIVSAHCKVVSPQGMDKWVISRLDKTTMELRMWPTSQSTPWCIVRDLPRLSQNIVDTPMAGTPTGKTPMENTPTTANTSTANTGYGARTGAGTKRSYHDM